MGSYETRIPLTIAPDSPALDRVAVLPPDDKVVVFGMHGAVAEHYKYTPKVEYASTLDYLVASVGGCLIGTFCGSLRRARVRVKPEDLTATAVGVVTPDDDGVLRLRSITMKYVLQVPEDQREAAEKVHEVHAGKCPNARSIAAAVEIDTELEMVSPVVA